MRPRRRCPIPALISSKGSPGSIHRNLNIFRRSRRNIPWSHHTVQYTTTIQNTAEFNSHSTTFFIVFFSSTWLTLVKNWRKCKFDSSNDKRIKTNLWSVQWRDWWWGCVSFWEVLSIHRRWRVDDMVSRSTWSFWGLFEPFLCVEVLLWQCRRASFWSSFLFMLPVLVNRFLPSSSQF